MNIRFEQLEALWWLWPVIVAAVLLGWAVARRQALWTRVADRGLLDRIAPGRSLSRHVVRAVVRVAALAFLVAALLDPRWGVTFRPVQQRGVDVMVVLDVSRSMLANDATPNRLTRAQQFIDDLLGALGGDRIGLVTFAGVASLKCPLTVDNGAFRTALEYAQPESVPRGGSLIGDAIRLASESFADDIKDHKAIIVLSDGEDQGSFAVEAASRIGREQGIPIFTVGIGSETGTRIPIDGGYVQYNGADVVTKLDGTLLEQIANASGGAYLPVGTAQTDLGDFYVQRIAPLARREFETVDVRRFTPRYQWFAAAALALFLVEGLVRPTASRREEVLA